MVAKFLGFNILQISLKPKCCRVKWVVPKRLVEMRVSRHEHSQISNKNNVSSIFLENQFLLECSSALS